MTTRAVPEREAIDLFAAGRALRDRISRRDHESWVPHTNRPDPVTLIESTNVGRLRSLIPVRYARMAASPFAFLRGAAILMAYDLGTSTPTTDVRVQCCGDPHVENFGVFATPERNVIFDINDFDETLPAPWEWDVKRLAASVHVAGRSIGLAEKQCSRAVVSAIAAYRTQMRDCALMTSIQIWYLRVDAHTVAEQIDDARLHQPASSRTHELVAADYVVGTRDGMRIADRPPKLFHLPDSDTIREAPLMFERYRESLSDDIASLVARYRLVDVAVKVVGVGSVGRRCAVGLLHARENDALLLQVKEARASVFETFAGPSRYAEHGRRVVEGERLMQAASDIFLGWTRSERGYSFYVRQLSDMKARADIGSMDAATLAAYAELCGKVLAIAHARSGEAAIIGGYLGSSNKFETAMALFATAYADQNDADYSAFLEAIRQGRLQVAGS